jgi:hypothetical protein
VALLGSGMFEIKGFIYSCIVGSGDDFANWWLFVFGLIHQFAKMNETEGALVA